MTDPKKKPYKPKITFAEPPPPLPPEPIGWIYGIPVKVTKQAGDLLAAFHMGAQTVLSTLAPHNVRVQGPQSGAEQTVDFSGTGSEEEDEFAPGPIDFQVLNRMNPLEREAFLSMHGLQTFQGAQSEYDPTHDTVREMVEKEILDKPEKQAEYHPSDDGEID